MLQDTGVEPVIPPIRYLYADDCNDDISIQLQIADHQSGLGWGDVVRIVDPFIRFKETLSLRINCPNFL